MTIHTPSPYQPGDCSGVSVDTIVRIGWAVEMNLSIVPTPLSEQR